MTNLTDLADACGTDKGSHQGYAKLYDRYLPGPDKPITLVELGVYLGDSMKLWCNNFRHEGTRIIGVDHTLTEQALNRIDYGTHQIPNLFEADQADPLLADLLNDAMGGFDVVIDDASHEGPKTVASFHTWWPYIKPGGLYVVEDTHCSYNTDHYKTAAPPLELPSARSPRYPRLAQVTVMEFLKRLADDVNWGIHGYNRFNPLYENIAYVHFYPGICFVGKR